MVAFKPLPDGESEAPNRAPDRRFTPRLVFFVTVEIYFAVFSWHHAPDPIAWLSLSIMLLMFVMPLGRWSNDDLIRFVNAVSGLVAALRKGK